MPTALYEHQQSRKQLKYRVLTAVLALAKYSGVFKLCRIMTSRDLRILGYHGAAIIDESDYSPGLFITADTFAKRLRFLAEQGYTVLPLDQSVRHLEAGTLPRNPVVITIDDGWYGTYKHFYPSLCRHGFSATLYVASYYFETQTQVFNVAASYAFWKARDKTLNLETLNSDLTGIFDLSVLTERQQASAALIEKADQLDHQKRQELLRKIYTELAIDGKTLEVKRVFSYINLDEAKDMAGRGISCQLHTHRHRFPVSDPIAARQEILDNRASLAAITEGELTHFCYPDGVFCAAQATILKELGIESATTTQYGFNRQGDSHFELSRFLDSERISDIEFEAEMTGFFEILRRFGIRI